MRCFKCNSLEDKVIDSRMSKDGVSIRRRRECIKCGYRFTTYEHLERNDMRVLKRNGSQEPFQRSKLLAGIEKACEKRPVTGDVMENAVEEIVSDLTAQNLREIPSSVIGRMVMRKLQEIDSVALVRYASVYRQFEDVGEFIDEIASLKKAGGDADQLQPELFGQSTG